MTVSLLIVAAHPDDEALGCGGLMARQADVGADVHVVFLADGVGARGESDTDAKLVESRRSAARNACRILGAKPPAFGDFPDNRMDRVDLLDIVKSIEGHIERTRPQVMLTHHSGDVNIDHRRTHEASLAACRPQKGHPVRTLMFFEVASSTEWMTTGSAPGFLPNWFEDISGTLDRKLAAMAAYEAELRESPHPRSLGAIENLARWRGATIGVSAAEAFMLGRHIG
jgi:N-acetylglucosamine malate deacetylase 1